MLKKGKKKKMGEGQDRRRVGLGCRSPFGKGKKLIWVVLSLIIKATHMVILDHFLISNSYFFSSSFFSLIRTSNSKQLAVSSHGENLCMSVEFNDIVE